MMDNTVSDVYPQQIFFVTYIRDYSGNGLLSHLTKNYFDEITVFIYNGD